jgi:hypothetical protein
MHLLLLTGQGPERLSTNPLNKYINLSCSCRTPVTEELQWQAAAVEDGEQNHATVLTAS